MQYTPANENKRTGRKIFVILFSLFLVIIIILALGYIGYFILTYSEYPFYQMENNTVVLSMEYLGKRDTLTALGVVSIIILALSIIYLGLLNYLKD